jgi:thiol:disulfide interchange protein DsbD
LAVRLTIEPEWHINANPASDEFLIPTSLEFASDALPFHVLDTVYPEALMVRLGFSESDVAVYSESALIGALVKADDSLRPGTYQLKGQVMWQACNDVSCLPPESRDFEMTIVVVGSGQETHDIDADVFAAMKFGPEAAPR